MMYIKPKCQKLTNILDYLVIISIDMQNVILTEQLNNTASIHPNLNFTNGSWMILLIGELKTNLMTCFRDLTATIQI